MLVLSPPSQSIPAFVVLGLVIQIRNQLVSSCLSGPRTFSSYPKPLVLCAGALAEAVAEVRTLRGPPRALCAGAWPRTPRVRWHNHSRTHVHTHCASAHAHA
eukprot:6207640-Pleurochrysis_carterae.AAC.3